MNQTSGVNTPKPSQTAPSGPSSQISSRSKRDAKNGPSALDPDLKNAPQRKMSSKQEQSFGNGFIKGMKGFLKVIQSLFSTSPKTQGYTEVATTETQVSKQKAQVTQQTDSFMGELDKLLGTDKSKVDANKRGQVEDYIASSLKMTDSNNGGFFSSSSRDKAAGQLKDMLPVFREFLTNSDAKTIQEASTSYAAKKEAIIQESLYEGGLIDGSAPHESEAQRSTQIDTKLSARKTEIESKHGSVENQPLPDRVLTENEAELLGLDETRVDSHNKKLFNKEMNSIINEKTIEAKKTKKHVRPSKLKLDMTMKSPMFKEKFLAYLTTQQFEGNKANFLRILYESPNNLENTSPNERSQIIDAFRSDDVNIGALNPCNSNNDISDEDLIDSIDTNFSQIKDEFLSLIATNDFVTRYLDN